MCTSLIIKRQQTTIHLHGLCADSGIPVPLVISTLPQQISLLLRYEAFFQLIEHFLCHNGSSVQRSSGLRPLLLNFARSRARVASAFSCHSSRPNQCLLLFPTIPPHTICENFPFLPGSTRHYHSTTPPRGPIGDYQTTQRFTAFLLPLSIPFFFFWCSTPQFAAVPHTFPSLISKLGHLICSPALKDYISAAFLSIKSCS